MASGKVNRETEFAVVPLAGTCWCSRMSLAFTVQLDPASLVLFIGVGVWGWRSWRRSGSRGPALLSDLMKLIPTLSSPYSSCTDNLASKAFQMTAKPPASL